MTDSGVVTYNIQSTAIEEDISFRSTIKQTKDKLEAEMTKGKPKEEKKEIKETLFRPLLMNLDSDEANNDDYG